MAHRNRQYVPNEVVCLEHPLPRQCLFAAKSYGFDIVFAAKIFNDLREFERQVNVRSICGIATKRVISPRVFNLLCNARSALSVTNYIRPESKESDIFRQIRGHDATEQPFGNAVVV